MIIICDNQASGNESDLLKHTYRQFILSLVISFLSHTPFSSDKYPHVDWALSYTLAIRLHCLHSPNFLFSLCCGDTDRSLCLYVQVVQPQVRLSSVSGWRSGSACVASPWATSCVASCSVTMKEGATCGTFWREERSCPRSVWYSTLSLGFN